MTLKAVLTTVTLTFTTAILANVALTTKASATQGVYGSWKFPQMVNGPLTIDAYITVAAGTVTAHSTCKLNGQTSEVEATSPAQVTASQITILAAAQKSVSTNGVNCDASVQPGTMTYVVSADDATLTLTAPGQGSMSFPRK